MRPDKNALKVYKIMDSDKNTILNMILGLLIAIIVSVLIINYFNRWNLEKSNIEPKEIKEDNMCDFYQNHILSDLPVKCYKYYGVTK